MISSDSLFHYTCSLENVCSIIKEGIRVSRSIENVSYLKDIYEIQFEPLAEDKPDQSMEFELSIPMACFCDIPIDSTNRHRKVYGNYALGFSKRWGIKKGINPVTYLSPSSDYSAAIRKLNILTGKFSIDDPNYDIRNAFFKIASFLKLYEGYYVKGKYENNSHRFYDEREWRYIPKDDFIQVAPPSHLRKRAKKIEDTIRVSLSDLKYLLVKKDEEKSIIKNIFEKEKIKLSNYNDLTLKSFEELT